MVDAPFTAGIDQAVDGNESRESGHRDMSGDASQETFEEAIESEVLPGPQCDVDVAEADGAVARKSKWGGLRRSGRGQTPGGGGT